MNKCVWVILLLGIIMAEPTPASNKEEAKQPIISIGSMIGRMVVAQEENPAIQLAFYDQLASELLQKYRCRVLCRTRSYDVAVENTIQNLSLIDSLNLSPDRIFSADFAIAANYNYAHLQGGTRMEGYVYAADLNNTGMTEITNQHFTCQCMADIPVTMADTIAQMLSLHRRSGGAVVPKTALPASHTILVIPFIGINTIKNLPEIEAMSSRIGSALQSKENLKLVDRTLLADVLKEHSLSKLTIENRTQSREIAKLVHADLILMGTVTDTGGGKWRLDVHLVDSQTGVIIGARYITKSSFNKMADMCEPLSAELLSERIEIPEFRSSTESRHREAKFILSNESFFHVQANTPIEMEGIWAARVRAAECAYLLSREDLPFAYEAANELAEWYLNHYAESWYFNKSITTLRAARFINAALSSFEHAPQTPCPLLVRADVLQSAGQVDEAMRLVEEHVRKYPGVNEKRVMTVKAWCEFKRGNLATANTLVEEVQNKYGKNDEMVFLLSKIMSQPSFRPVNTDAEYEKLKKIFNMPMAVASKGGTQKELERFLELAIEIDGPREVERILANKELVGEKMGGAVSVYYWDLISLMMRAKCFELMRKREEAIRKYRDVAALTDQLVQWGADKATPPGGDSSLCKRYGEMATEKLKQLEAQGKKVPSLSRTAAEIKRFPSDRKIYLIPVGNVNQEQAKEVLKGIEDFYGAKTEILSNTKIPESATAVKPGSYVLRSKDLLQGYAISDDALYVIVFVTDNFDKELQMGSYNPLILSSKGYRAGSKLSTGYLIHNALAEFRTLYVPRFKQNGSSYLYYKECDNPPCIYSKPPFFREAVNVLLSMCPACQREYKKADFDKIHNDLMDYLKKAGVKIVKAGE